MKFAGPESLHIGYILATYFDARQADQIKGPLWDPIIKGLKIRTLSSFLASKSVSRRFLVL